MVVNYLPFYVPADSITHPFRKDVREGMGHPLFWGEYTFFMIAGTYTRFTEEANALDYLEKTVTFIKSVDNNPLDWKWIVLAIHGALYSFMICALKGTTPDNVCFKTKTGKTKLIDFLEALRRCQDSAWTNISGFRNALQVSAKQKQAVKRIHNEFRNQFVHYQPTIWSIELAGMADIVMQVLEVVRSVSLEMGAYYVHHEPTDIQKIADLISEGQGTLQRYAALQEQLNATRFDGTDVPIVPRS